MALRPEQEAFVVSLYEASEAKATARAAWTEWQARMVARKDRIADPNDTYAEQDYMADCAADPEPEVPA